jgi:hypothetical protein
MWKKYRDVNIIMWQLGYHSINPGFEYMLYESQKHCSCKGQAKLFLCYENFMIAKHINSFLNFWIYIWKKVYFSR